MKYNNMLKIEVFGKNFGDLRFAINFNADYVKPNEMLQVIYDFLGSERNDVVCVLDFADVRNPYMSPYPCRFADESYLKLARYLQGRFPNLYKRKRYTL